MRLKMSTTRLYASLATASRTVDRDVSRIRAATRIPEASVSAATSHIAQDTPNASAATPAMSAPIA